MYPQFSRATTGSSFEVARRITQGAGVETTFIEDFHDNPGYTRLLKEQIDAHISADETLLFSAHSLPQRFVDEGDPYVQQVEISAAIAAGDREYFLSYQSKTGPVKWVGPNTIVEAKRLLSNPRKKLFVVPLSFVCDNIETLHEIDIDLVEKLGANGSRMRRMPMFNDDPRFAEVLADIIRRKAGLNGSV
jgi:ferrochelatase